MPKIQLENGTQGRERHFTKEDIQIAKEYIKRGSTSLAFRKLQIQITVSKIKCSENIKWWQGCEETGPLIISGENAK